MKKTSYLQRIGSRWYVRVKVPRVLQGRLRNTHVRRALGTGDLAEANRRKWQVIATIRQELDRLQGLNPNQQGVATCSSRPIAPAEEPRRYQPRPLPASLTGQLATPRETLDELLERWLSTVDYLNQTKQQHRRAYQEFRLFFGGDRSPEAVTPQVALEYVERRLRPSSQAYNTKRRKLDSLGVFWEWLASQQLVPRDPNPWKGFKLASRKAASTPTRAKRPYTSAELVTLLSRPPPYEGLADVIALGLLTGMRLDEICALRVLDVQPDPDGGFWLKVAKAKTRAGIRTVSLRHPLGLRVVDSRWRDNASPDDQFFPEFRGGGYDRKLSWAVSKAFGRHRTRCGLSGETDFHSFRRTFITLLENGGVDQVRIARYVGHDLPTLAFSVYSGGSTPATMRETAAAVRYPTAVESALATFLDRTGSTTRGGVS